MAAGGGRPGPQSTPPSRPLDTDRGRRDPGRPPLHRPPDPERPAHRPGADRPGQHRLGHRDIARWNPPRDWIISGEKAHPALVSEAGFVAAQGKRATTTAPGRTCLLAALLHCGVCGRRMDSCWSRDRTLTAGTPTGERIRIA
ncbi:MULTISPECIES: hypothetical protein [unclassified Streptomyces]|uniref:hypothetical protein n=1 Tax=unclassified Streptomyces TaxID=2593676 RepID=UPI000B2A3110|nr:hypothetical protein [Streptomyces sp. CNQ-509]